MAESGKEPELDQFRGVRAVTMEFIQHLIEFQKIHDRVVAGGHDVLKTCAGELSAALGRAAGAGLVNQDPPHGFRGGPHEVGARRKQQLLPGGRELDEHLVDQGRRLERMAGVLRRQLTGGQRPEFVVHEGEQLGRRRPFRGRAPPGWSVFINHRPYSCEGVRLPHRQTDVKAETALPPV